MIPIDYAETNHYKKQILIAHVAGALHSGFVCKTGCVLAEKGGRGGAAGGGSGGSGASPTGNSGGEGDSTPRNKLPPNDSQLKHMFEDREGHVPDTPGNRQLLEDVANDPNSYYGTDRWGKQWYARMQEDGSQVWVCARDGVIQDGGINQVPHQYDELTGFSSRYKMMMEAMKMFSDNYGKQGFLTLFYLLDEDWERAPSNAVGDLASEMCPYTFKERQPADIATYGDYGLQLFACLKESNREDAETAYKAAVRMLKFYRDHYSFALDPFLSRFTLTAFQEKFATLEEEAVSLGDWTMLLRRVAEAEAKES